MAIGLAITAHEDETLVLLWSCGGQTSSSITEFESPVFRRIHAPDDA